MRQLSKNKKRYPKIIALVVIALVVLAGALFVLDKYGIINIFNHPTNSGPTAAEKKIESETNAKNKANYIENTSPEKGNTKNSSGVTVPVPDSPSTITLLANQQGSNVVVTTKLNGQGYSSGKCILTVSSNGKNTTQSADIIYQPEYSTCAGFSVPVSSVGAGSWSIALSATPQGGSEITKTTSLVVK